MNKIQNYLAQNIKSARARKKMTQTDLANECDTSTNYIGLIETEKRFPSADMMERIVDALMIEPHELFLKPNTRYVSKESKKDRIIAKIIKIMNEEE